MLRVLLWSTATFAVILTVYSLGGGHLGVLFQPFHLMIIVAMVVGLSAASGRLRVWGTIARDLRHAGRLEPATTINASTAQKRRQVLATVGDARVAAMAGGFLAALFGIIRLFGLITEPPEVIGHFTGAALSAIFIGLLVAYGILAPIGARLADLYDRDRAGTEPASIPSAVPEASASPAPARWKRILVAAVILVASAVVTAGGYFYGTFDPLLAAVGFGPKPEPAGPPFMELPTFSVNLNEEGDRRIVKAKICLELANVSDMYRVESLMPRVMDIVQTYLAELHFKDLQGQEARTHLREGLYARINFAVRPLKVTDLLITELLVQ